MKTDYSYQPALVKQCFDALVKGDKTVVLAACPGAGKTHMGIDIMLKYLQKFPNSNALVLAHGQVILRQQWLETVRSRSVSGYSVIIQGKDAYNTLKHQRLSIALPQTLTNAKVYPIDLLVVDESHQRFLATESQELISRLKPTHILLLTGTPSHFVNNPDYTVVGITIEELLDYNVLVDPLIEIIKTNYSYSIKDFDWRTMRLKDSKLKKGETKRTLDEILPQLIKRLTSQRRADPIAHNWSEKTTDWETMISDLHKTMIVCNNQRQAIDVCSYFRARKINAAISISDLNEGNEEIEEFKKDESIPLLIVVSRGTLGFNYNELMNVIDLTGSLNVNRIFQLLCRVVRRSKKEPQPVKLFIKATNAEMSYLTYFVMSFVVALSTKKHYYSYKTEYRLDRIPVPNEFKGLVDNHKKGSAPVPDLPSLLTFHDLKNDQGTIAYTTFRDVISRVYSSKTEWTVEEAKAEARNYKLRIEFMSSAPYAWLKKRIPYQELRDFLEEYFPGTARNKWPKSRVLEMAKTCKNYKEFVANTQAFNAANHHGYLDEVKKILPSDRTLRIQRLLRDPDFEITRDGIVTHKGRQLKCFLRNGRPTFGIPTKKKRHDTFHVYTVMWEKFKGNAPTGRGKILCKGKLDVDNLYFQPIRHGKASK